jgi:hypothetical protein
MKSDQVPTGKFSAAIAALTLAFSRGSGSDANTDDILMIVLGQLSPGKLWDNPPRWAAGRPPDSLDRKPIHLPWRSISCIVGQLQLHCRAGKAFDACIHPASTELTSESGIQGKKPFPKSFFGYFLGYFAAPTFFGALCSLLPEQQERARRGT